jgi:hypothetical protein
LAIHSPDFNYQETKMYPIRLLALFALVSTLAALPIPTPLPQGGNETECIEAVEAESAALNAEANNNTVSS